MNSRIKRYIAMVGDLPSVPAVASAVLQVAGDPASSADDLRQVIDRDPALSARILKVSNSSLYSFSRKIETVQHSIALLGFRTVTNIVMAASLREVFTHFGLAEKQLWEHSTLAGTVAARLTEHAAIDVDREEAFTAGLLHDLGKIALNNTSRKKYTNVLAKVYNEGVSFTSAELEEFGFDHAELGACVAAKWKLSSSLENAIRYHHAEVGPDKNFVKKDEMFNMTDEPGHQELCDREQAFFLKAIQEDLDLTESMDAAVNSLRIVLAAEQSINEKRVVELD